MRYELIKSNDDEGFYGISDSHCSHYQQGDLKANGGDIVCLRPGVDDHVMSEVHWPENARRIVALLNMYADWATEEIEKELRFKMDCEGTPMELPPEAHVEFSDDHPQFMGG